MSPIWIVSLSNTMFCVFQLVVGLGIVIFNALDMGYSYGEERAISRDLEELIDLMTSGAGNISITNIFKHFLRTFMEQIWNFCNYPTKFIMVHPL